MELFAGTKSIGKAFEKKGHEVFSVEWSKDFENIDLYEDIGKLKAKDILEKFGQPDVIWASPDCFVGGTLIWTDKGYKTIENINTLDNVLTHNNNYKQVYRTIKKKTNEFYNIKIAGSEIIQTTPNHPFYVREKKMVWNNDTRSYWVELLEPEFVQAQDLSKKYRVGIPINTKSELPNWNGVEKNRRNQFGIEEKWIENKLHNYLDNKDFWWLIGRYFGDGCYVLKPDYYRLEICCSKNEDEEIRPVLDRLGFNYQLSEKATTKVFNFGTKELVYFVDQFGKGSLGKQITPAILNLPIDLLQSFLDGYISADGSWEENKNNRVCHITTISRELAYGLQQCILKAYKRYCSMNIRESHIDIIEGREVNARKSYLLGFYEMQNKNPQYLIENDMAWVNVKCVDNIKTDTTPIYNLSVEDDESYTVNNFAVHNCTSFSIAAISHHRRKNEETGNLDPVSDYAKFCDKVDQNVLALIKELNPKYYFIENPRGGMRKMTWMQGLPRYTVTYCKYETDKPTSERRMKPTDIWTNHPNPDFIPMCKNGDPCHASAPRGSRTGTQGLKGSKERSVIPHALCEHIVDICEKGLGEDRLYDECKSCKNKWSSIECEMCENFDMKC